MLMNFMENSNNFTKNSDNLLKIFVNLVKFFQKYVIGENGAGPKIRSTEVLTNFSKDF